MLHNHFNLLITAANLHFKTYSPKNAENSNNYIMTFPVDYSLSVSCNLMYVVGYVNVPKKRFYFYQLHLTVYTPSPLRNRFLTPLSPQEPPMSGHLDSTGPLST